MINYPVVFTLVGIKIGEKKIVSIYFVVFFKDMPKPWYPWSLMIPVFDLMMLKWFLSMSLQKQASYETTDS